MADSHLVSRLTARRQCPQCKHIYNLLSQPPHAAGVCDSDGTALVERDDDREPVVRERLHAYQELTGPILRWYGEAAVFRIDGALPPDQVREAIERVLLPLRMDSKPAILTA